MTTTPRERWHPEPHDIDPDAPFDFPDASELHWLYPDEVKRLRSRALRIWNTARMPMLRKVGSDGKPLYRVTSSGGWARTKPLSPSRRRAVISRDQRCVLCGAGGPFEVDHIVRYVDGGSNEMNNLRALCHPCHRKRGGRA